jgi:acyl carrier protein
MNSDRGTLAGKLLDQHVDVREAMVFTSAELGAGEAELLAIVLPHDYCNGADLRDALIDAIGLEPAAPVVVLVPDEAAFEQGKADEAALVGLAADLPYVYRWQAPAGEIERTLCAVVSESLDRERSSVSDNFVDLGGDSMTAIKVVSEFEARSGIALPLESLFEAESIGDLAELAAEQTPAR